VVVSFLPTSSWHQGVDLCLVRGMHSCLVSGSQMHTIFHRHQVERYKAFNLPVVTQRGSGSTSIFDANKGTTQRLALPECRNACTASPHMKFSQPQISCGALQLECRSNQSRMQESHTGFSILTGTDPALQCLACKRVQKGLANTHVRAVMCLKMWLVDTKTPMSLAAQ
jgi:hypothetical protein